MRRIPILVLLLILTVSGLAAQLTLPAVFADHMVLQRKQAVPVWGTANPNVAVVVTFAGQEKQTQSDAEGHWRVDLDALSASAESRPLSVSAAGEALIFTDVLVGEVWLCGGQSNMDFTLNGLTGRARDPHYEPVAAYIREEIATANDPLFRHFKVKRIASAHEPQTGTPGQWIQATPGQVKNFSATGYFFGRELRRELNVPVALLSCNWGGTRVEPWIPAERFADSATLQQYYQMEMARLEKNSAAWDEATAKAKYAKALELWEERAAEAKAAGTKEPSRPRYQTNPELSNGVPASLYNGMLHSLIPYGIKGAIWYQGESNAHGGSAPAYQERFTALIEGWRELWGQESLYFYWCQLASYKAANDQPLAVDHWATVCDQLRRTLILPNTGMAVLNDIGEASDIHPKNKVDAGKRLSLWALKQAYGQSLVVSGPLYKSHVIEGNKFRVTFDHVGSGLMVGHKHLMDATVAVDEPLQRFQIAGSDGQWKWAQARILSADTIEVWHSEIAAPLEVRYAWSANPEGANLYNKEGLPASTFRAGNAPVAATSGHVTVTVPQLSVANQPAALKLPEMQGYREVYQLEVPLQANYGNDAPYYSMDHSDSDTAPFSRIAYTLELVGADGVRKYAFVSMDAFTDKLSEIGVPTAASSRGFLQTVSNLTVRSNVDGVVECTDTDGGNIEFWAGNYSGGNAKGITNASDAVYDFGDKPSDQVPGYGCMQVHNWQAKQTIFAFNAWGSSNSLDIGIGNAPAKHTDWTFAKNAGDYSFRRLTVYVK